MAETRLPWPVPADLDPSQIAAMVRAAIAARSPAHAALVAAFGELPEPPAGDLWKQAKPRPLRPVRRKTQRRRLLPSDASEIAARYQRGVNEARPGNGAELAREFGISRAYVPVVASRARAAARGGAS